MIESRDGRVIYVVADGRKVRFLHDGEGKMHDVQDFDSEKHEATPGKMPTGATPKDAAKDGFARVVADRLNALVNSGEKIDGFVLAAPAPVLHEIRQHLSKPAAAKLIKTFDKDFTNIPAHDLRKHFDIPATGWVLPS
ncbi:host attachment protein [Acetobacter cerevisiae]|uniref:Peptidase n=1 Tax=Acetobacter cerevisiae TaxID=178900 RepID=A0A149QB00_9PROT|nr:host attachment protein [Acetobacter cerevisiae]KXU94525.1 peptidase [Acetobacter cerevisiae]GBQ07622.1 AtsE protein [Acetobacter cerevisiae DSM 14362]